ncbi:MAG: TMEM165/GDT1 family protein, partial [Sphingomonadaceae bacterium]
PMLSFEAATLMLALALIFAGAAALMKQKPPDPVEGWRMGAFLSSFLAFFILELGDKTQFLTFAIALRSGSFWLSMAGATAGVIVASAVAILLGRSFAANFPVKAIRRGAGALFLLLGACAAIAALRLI